MIARDTSDNSVKGLHERIAREATAPPRRKKPAYSRAALLDLIDILSRRSAAGLAIIAGLSIWFAMAASGDYPGRTSAWLVMIILALAFCRRSRAAFRSGASGAHRQFRWRANYTAGLSVLGVIFASAPILLAPVSAAENLQLMLIALTLFGATVVALLHAAHITSAAAFIAPAALFVLLAGIRSTSSMGIVACAVAGLGAAGLTWLTYQMTLRNSVRRNPRTTLLRRDVIDNQDIRNPANVENPGNAAYSA